MARYKRLRARRINTLVKNGFLHKEAVELTRPRVTKAGTVVPSPLILSHKATRNMIKDRRKALRTARKAGLPIEPVIRDIYEEEDWLDAEGDMDPWEMFRPYLDESPTAKGKKRTGDIDKGNVQAQKARYKARQADRKARGEAPPSGDARQWIRELTRTIERTTDPIRKSQFEAQKARLEARL